MSGAGGGTDSGIPDHLDDAVKLIAFMLSLAACSAAMAAPVVNQLVIVDAATGAVLTPPISYGTRCSVRAICSADTASVQFNFDGKVQTAADNSAPFDSVAGVPPAGNHTMQVTPYAKSNARGRNGATMSIGFAVTAGPTASPSPTPSITPIPTPSATPVPTPSPTPPSPTPSSTPTTPTPSPSPIVTPSATPVQPAIGALTCNGDAFNDGAVLVAGTSYTVTALVNTATGSVVFKRENGQVQTDSTSPYQYTMAGPSVGAHSLQATPWSADNGTGTAGTPIMVRFTVAKATPSPSPSPTSTPTPSPTPSTPSPTPTITPSPTATPSPSLTATPSATAPPTGAGIASKYPNDANIASDPNVLFADDFESYNTPDEAKARWGGGNGTQRMRIATEPDHVYSGKKAIEYSLPPSATEISCTLWRVLSPEQDTAFIRFYQKWASDYATCLPDGTDCGANHNGLRLSAKYPNQAGIIPPADGTGFFLFLVQNAKSPTIVSGPNPPGNTDVYAYWPKQRQNFGDNWYPNGSGTVFQNNPEYPDFKPYPLFTPELNRWYCYELMVKANTVGQNNGEVKYWIDGKVAGDFPNLFLRSIDSLKIDWASFNLQETIVHKTMTKWHDNVVIAKSYIGPMSTASPTPPPQTASVTVKVVKPTAGDSYDIFYGSAPDAYGSPVPVPAGSASVSIPNLNVGATYYFASQVHRGSEVSAVSPPIAYTVGTSVGWAKWAGGALALAAAGGGAVYLMRRKKIDKAKPKN
jgi:hypothetical protein